MQRSEFIKIVKQGIVAIPKKFRNELSNVEVVIYDEPTNEQLRKVNLLPGSILFGLYEGVPQTKRGIGYSGILPDKITIFQKAIEQVTSDSKERVKEIVKDTIYHEIAHHFGTCEERIRQIEIKRNKK
jgi:predicted Zn-dependent protease with MMP-like domain